MTEQEPITDAELEDCEWWVLRTVPNRWGRGLAELEMARSKMRRLIAEVRWLKRLVVAAKWVIRTECPTNYLGLWECPQTEGLETCAECCQRWLDAGAPGFKEAERGI